MSIVGNLWVCPLRTTPMLGLWTHLLASNHTCNAQALVTSIAASPDAPYHGMEHDCFVLLCGIEECLQRVYQVSGTGGQQEG